MNNSPIHKVHFKIEKPARLPVPPSGKDNTGSSGMKVQAIFIGQDVAVIKVSEEVFKNPSESNKIRIAFQQRSQRKSHIALIAWNSLGNGWDLAGPPDLMSLVRSQPLEQLHWTEYEL